MRKKTTPPVLQDTNNLEWIAFLKTLRTQLKAKGYRYSDLAQHLEVSEITVKRLFTGRSFSLKLILLTCDFLNVSFLDVAGFAKTVNRTNAYVLTKDQDQFFGSNPSSYFIFINLYRRVPVQKVLADWKLDELSFFKLLRTYEKLNLIELLPKNAFKFKMSGLIHVPKGRLQKVLQKYDQQFLQYMQSRLADDPSAVFQSAEVLLSQDHIEEFKSAIRETLRKFKEHAFVDETLLPKSKTRSVRLLLAFSPYESNWN